MRKIEKLKAQAKESARLRSHSLKPFYTLDKRGIAQAECRHCGMSVTVNCIPAPNEINIAGGAVALNCYWKTCNDPTCKESDCIKARASGNKLLFAQFERFELSMTMEQAESGSHQGQCDDDVKTLSNVPAIRSQLDALDADKLRDELREYGAWDAEELQDHEQNLQRILWIACSNISEENN